MGTKMKGLFKGLRYISQIFEDEKEEEEMQIGLPTDVKHVAHIGWDGPSAAVESPSWMKDFKSPEEGGSGDLGSNKEDKESRKISEDSRSGSKARRDMSDAPRSSRRHHSEGDLKKEGSTKSRHSRRNNSKDSAEGSVRSARLSADLGPVPESPSHGLPEIPKKSRKKKPRDADGGSSRSRGKAASRSTSVESDQDSASSCLDDDKERVSNC